LHQTSFDPRFGLINNSVPDAAEGQGKEQP